jgi:hypothetical protein
MATEEQPRTLDETFFNGASQAIICSSAVANGRESPHQHPFHDSSGANGGVGRRASHLQGQVGGPSGDVDVGITAAGHDRHSRYIDELVASFWWAFAAKGFNALDGSPAQEDSMVGQQLAMDHIED